MASYGILLALSSFKYDRNNGLLGFSPKIKGNFSSFFALGDIWGNFYQNGKYIKINLLHGEFFLQKFEANFKFNKVIVNGEETTLPVKLLTNDTIEFEE